MDRRLWFISAGLMVLYILPLLLLGQNASIMIWDNLDSNVVWNKLLIDSGQVFATNDSIIPSIMDGLPRLSFGSEFKFILLLNYLFGPFTAYCINEILIHLCAFIGMYLLLKRHVLKFEKDSLVLFGPTIGFALLPFWPSGGLTVAGMPLVLYVFLNIRQGQSSRFDWLILLLVPFYSSFVLGYSFFLGVMSLFWLYDLYKRKTINYTFGGAILLMVVLYLVVEYRLVESMLMHSSFVSHRLEFRQEPVNLMKAIGRSVRSLFISQPHAKVLQLPFIIGTICWALVIVNKQKLKESLLFRLLTFISFVAVFHGFWQWSGLIPIKEKISLLRMFQFDRFYFLNPLAWYISWSLALSVIVNYGLGDRRKKACLLIALQIVLLFAVNVPFSNMIKDVTGLGERKPSYKEFYAEGVFTQIKDYIGEDQRSYKVVSVGIHPAVAQYNGFYTLDGYIANYSLEYKHKFRKIIEKELDKNDKVKRYFDHWGNRCYVFSSELGKSGGTFDKRRDISLNNFEINTRTLKEMGGEYIISAANITNPEKTGLIFLRLFEHPDSLYRVYLYKVNP